MFGNFSKIVAGYKEAHEKGEDTTLYQTAVAACTDFNRAGEDNINANVVHAIHEFAHMLAADPAKFLAMENADALVSHFFEEVSRRTDSPEVQESLRDHENYKGLFVTDECEHNTGSAFARSLNMQADFEIVFEKFTELQMIGSIKQAISNIFSSPEANDPELHFELLSGDEALDFLRKAGMPVDKVDDGQHEYASSGETSGPVAHNDNGAEER